MTAERLADCLALDLNQVLVENRHRVEMTLRNRFLAGLYEGLQKFQELPDIWMHIGNNAGAGIVESLHWVRHHEDIKAHEVLNRKPPDAQHKNLSKLITSLGSTRKSISSTSSSTRESLYACFPAWRQPRRYGRPELMHTLSWLLTHDGPLTHELADNLRAEYWSGRVLPTACPDRRPAPRL